MKTNNKGGELCTVFIARLRYVPTYLPACLPIYLSIESSFDPFIQPANQPTIYVCVSISLYIYLFIIYICVYTHQMISYAYVCSILCKWFFLQDIHVFHCNANSRYFLHTIHGYTCFLCVLPLTGQQNNTSSEVCEGCQAKRVARCSARCSACI